MGVSTGAGATAIVPGRGAALTDPAMCRDGIATTRAFIRELFESVKAGVASGHDLKRVYADTDAVLRPRYGQQFIYEHSAVPATEFDVYLGLQGIPDACTCVETGLLPAHFCESRDPQRRLPLFHAPEELQVIVAGTFAREEGALELRPRSARR